MQRLSEPPEEGKICVDAKIAKNLRAAHQDFVFYTRRLNVRGFPGSAKIIKKPPNFGGLNGIGMRTGREPDSDAKIMIYRRYGTASTVTAKAVKKYLMSKKF